MVNEAKTHDLVRDIFNKDELRETFILEREKSDNPIIQKLLKTASKRGSGDGRPDLIISFPEIPKLLIVIECKAEIKRHESKEGDKYSDYAVDGVKLYSQYLSKEFNVISIAISGEEKNNLKVSNFLQLKDELTRELSTKLILSITDYLRLFKEDKEREEIEYQKLMKYSRELNNYLREELKVSEKDRALLVSGILLALDDNGFRKAYPEQESSEFSAEHLLETIEKRLKKEKIPEGKRNSMIRNYSFIKDLSIIKNKKENKLYELILQIHNNVHFFIEEYKFNYDIIGAFYGEFLRYANGDKSLGIVLTPRHITDLFVDLANVKKTDTIYDNCCGTGGFIISAMKRMIKDSEEDSEETYKIKNQRLIGVEADGKMFTLGCANMILMKDGKSNFYNDDGLKLSEKVNKNHKPTVGFLNPPYSQKKPASEFNFILANLNALEKNSLCVAIVPMSCAIGKDYLKEKILENHTLEAVMSMPDELFYPVGTVTCIMVFRAGIKHNSKVKTWFGYWKDDGFMKLKKEGRIDSNNTWEAIKKEWLENYNDRNEIAGKCIKANIGAEDEWCVEAYLETDYRKLTEKYFSKLIKDIVVFKILSNQDIKGEVSARFSNKTLPLKVDEWKYFELEYIFPKIKPTNGITTNELIPGDEIPYIAAKKNTNGLDVMCSKKGNEQFISEGNCIVFIQIGAGSAGYATYQEKDFIGMSGKTSCGYNNKINKYNGIFLVAILDQERPKFSFGRSWTGDRLRSTKIKLPVDSHGEPDWQFMEDYIKSLPYSKALEN